MPDTIRRGEQATRILKALQEGPLTVKQLASVTGIPDRELRSTLDEIRDHKYVLPAGYYERSQLWRINAAVVTGFEEFSGRLPLHELQDVNVHANLVDIALSGLVKCGPVPEEGSINYVEFHGKRIYPLLTKYLYEISQLYPDMEKIADIQSELVRAYKNLGSTVKLLEQIIKYKDYWTQEGIEEIKKAPLIENSSERLSREAIIADTYLSGGKEHGNTESVSEQK